MKQFKALLIGTILISVLGSCQNNTSSSSEETPGEYTHRIPAGENTWISHNQQEDREIIKKEGIRNWKDINKPVYSYFRIHKAGELNLALNLKVPEGTSKLKVSLGSESKEITVKNQEYKTIDVGSFEVQKGYQKLKIEALEKSGNYIADIQDILTGGPATEAGINFVEDNFHFGRRGPSVHLRYELPDEEVTYFYNEIEVPEGEDVIGSYFMANGFSHGYFGIQVNSEEERRILFSVWSPYDTQDPNEIPDDYKIELLKKGGGVQSGEFGNEGSGGQSYKVFNWKSGTTYKFLLKGKPAGEDKTDYTAWFYAPETGKWELIASFRRPYTDTYLGDFYSFLENFTPATGDTSRKAYYKNQWVYTENGWIESTKARFTADATARQGHRLDYAGGVENGIYFMKNCGFFDETTEIDTNFEREATGNVPQIDFEDLP